MDERLFCKGYTWGFFSPAVEMQTEEADMKNDRDFTVYGKKAEKTLKEWYVNR